MKQLLASFNFPDQFNNPLYNNLFGKNGQITLVRFDYVCVFRCFIYNFTFTRIQISV